MTKIFIVAFIAIAHVSYAAEALRPSVTEKVKAKILESFPYEPNNVDSNADTDPAAEINPAIVLPKVIVHAPKPLMLRREEVLSRSELSVLIRKKYPGASLKGQDPLHYESGLPNYGALMYAEEKRVLAIKELSDFSMALSDAAEGKKLRKMIQETFIRRSDAFLDAMDKSANNGRR